MIHRPIEQLPELTQEIMYLDELTLEQRVGIVIYIEQLSPTTVFVYVASPYKHENIHEEMGFQYRDIIVFDNLPNEDDSGVFRDPILGMYGKVTGDST